MNRQTTFCSTTPATTGSQATVRHA